MASTWRILATLAFPKRLAAAEPSDEPGGLPKRLELVSRIAPGSRQVDSTRIGLRSSELSVPLPSNFEAGELLIEVAADSVFDAVARAHPLLELAVDELSFDLQATVQIVQTDAVDVTPPVAIGDKRPFQTFSGYPGDKFGRSQDLGSIQTEPSPPLRSFYREPGDRVRAALRWYSKALAATYLQDRFVFLWIALEIFAVDSGIEVVEPLTLRCKHQLETCPECGQATARRVDGRSNRAFLEARGLDHVLSKKTWELRQMLHGAIPFNSDKLTDLPVVTQRLQAIVAGELKSALDIAPASPPIVLAGVPTVHPSLSLGGIRAIDASDLTWP
jgi:hypothetical protein